MKLSGVWVGIMGAAGVTLVLCGCDRRSNIPSGWNSWQDEETGTLVAYPPDWVAQTATTPAGGPFMRISRKAPEGWLWEEIIDQSGRTTGIVAERGGRTQEFSIREMVTLNNRPLNAEIGLNRLSLQGIASTEELANLISAVDLEYFRERSEIQFNMQVKTIGDRPVAVQEWSENKNPTGPTYYWVEGETGFQVTAGCGDMELDSFRRLCEDVVASVSIVSNRPE